MNRRRLLAGLWFLLAAFLVYWAFRLRGQCLVVTDTMEYVFPEKWVNVDSWRRGVVPLWNPAIACGTPHLANFQSASFYPPFWLWNVTGLWDWFYFMALAHVAWAVTGFFLWARDREVPPVPAFLAALSFGLSTQATNLWGFPTHLATLAWMPWVLRGTGRFMDRPSVRNGAVLSVCLALQWLAGYLQISAYTVLFLLAWTAWKRPSARVWFGLAAAVGAAAAATALQWLPTAEYLANTRRVPHLSHVYSLKGSEYLAVLAPEFVGLPGTEGYRGSLPNTVFLPGYAGVGVLLLSLAGLIFLRKTRDRFFPVAAVLALVWAAGMNLPPWRWLFGRWVGWLEPAKASFLWTFCACTAAAVVFARAWPVLGRKRAGRVAAIVLGIVVLLDLFSVPSRCVRHQPDPWRDPEVTGSMRQLARMTGEGRMVSLRSRDGRTGSGRKGHAGFLWESAYQGFPNMGTVFGIRTAGAHLSTTVDGYQNLLLYLQKGFPYSGRILDAAGVRAIVLPERLEGIKYEVGMTRGGMIFHSNAGALPQAWRVSQVVEMPDRASLMNELTKPDVFLEDRVFTEDAEGGRAVLLPPSSRPLRSGSRPKESLLERLRRALSGATPSRAFTDREPSPSRALFETDFRERGWMVFSESYFPGWRAWVDGTPVPIFRANGLFMTVPLKQAGLHRTIFRYEPTSFRLGLFVSLVFVVTAGVFLLFLGKAGTGYPGSMRRKDERAM